MLEPSTTPWDGVERRKCLLTTQEVAERLGVSGEVVARLRAERRLAAVNLGSARRPLWRFTEYAIRACIAAGPV